MERSVEAISLMIYLLKVAAHFGSCSISYIIPVIYGATFDRWQMANDE
jgi:hypothetical protein